MKTEKEVRERFEDIESVIKIYNKMGYSDPVFNAFHIALEWVLRDSEVKSA